MDSTAPSHNQPDVGAAEGVDSKQPTSDSSSTRIPPALITNVHHIQTRALALDHLGPNITLVRTSVCQSSTMRSWDTTEYKCICPTCPFSCRVTSPTIDLRSSPAVLEITKDHSHRPTTWEDTYANLMDYLEKTMWHDVPPKWNEDYRKPPGLPYTIRSYLITLLEKDPTLHRYDAWLLTEEKFGSMDLLRLFADNRRLMEEQVEMFLKSRRGDQGTERTKIDPHRHHHRYNFAQARKRIRKRKREEAENEQNHSDDTSACRAKSQKQDNKCSNDNNN